MKDFYISYCKKDQQWAKWIASSLERAGYSVVIQAWDFKPGDNFVEFMNNSLNDTERMIAVLSDEYIESLFTQAEWMVAFVKDPTNCKRTLIPVRVADVVPQGLLSTIIYIDLYGISDESIAERRLLDGLDVGNIPRRVPTFPELSNNPNKSTFPSHIKNINIESLPINAEQYASIHFGIITALPKELAAMRLMLAGEKKVVINNRLYYIGKIPSENENHLVAIALLSDMGNNMSSIYATRLFFDFSNIEHIIMCGIAGGVPSQSSLEKDVRLGDIVISDKNGVVQYDYIKQSEGGIKEYRFPPRPPSSVLLSAVKMLKSDEELGIYPWEEYLKLGSRMHDGSRPSDNLDAQGKEVNYQTDQSRKEGYPKVHLGTIAAANILQKDSGIRDYLSDKYGVKAIEMEGSGIADATWAEDKVGYLVVRGICDFCDGKKGDLWQGAAAVAAASYVRALIGSIPAI